jgi:hypothetical protein
MRAEIVRTLRIKKLNIEGSPRQGMKPDQFETQEGRVRRAWFPMKLIGEGGLSAYVKAERYVLEAVHGN